MPTITALESISASHKAKGYPLNDRKHLIIVGDTIGLPNGFAPSSRTKYLAMACAEAGITVEIVLAKPSEYAGAVSNYEVNGHVSGIHFEYASGSTTLSKKFLGRRVQFVKGLFKTCAKIYRRSLENNNLFVLAYTRNIDVLLAMSLICKWRRIPLILELCEWPLTWPYRNIIFRLKNVLFCKYALSIVDGAIVISDLIAQIVMDHNNKSYNKLVVIKIPILSGKKESPLVLEMEQIIPEKYVMFCGNLHYKQTVEHVINAFCVIADRYRELALVIVGSTSDKKCLQSYLDQAAKSGVSERIIFAGFVSENDLSYLYANAVALLIPLFNDELSCARFPTKLAEYLFAGRPVVTTSVGEVRKHLQDEINAYLVESDSPVDFGEAIGKILADPEKADIVAKNGRELAEKLFSYSSYSAAILSFIDSLKANRCPNQLREGAKQ